MNQMMHSIEPDPRFAAAGCLFFGVGAPKCATTWLHAYLAGHPQVRVPEIIKEMHYWDTIRPPHVQFMKPNGIWQRLYGTAKRAGLRLLKGDRGRRIATEWAAWNEALHANDPRHTAYAHALFSGAGAARAVGEITPNYDVLDQPVLAEMAALSPNSRFIFIMRDPVTRLLAHLRMRVSQASEGQVQPDALTTALSRALDGQDREHPVEQSQYDKMVRKLEETVPAERVGYFFYETLFDQAQIDRLTRFLGVDPHKADLETRVFAGKGRDVMPDADVLALAYDRLAETYTFIQNRFGAEMPAKWSCKPSVEAPSKGAA